MDFGNYINYIPEVHNSALSVVRKLYPLDEPFLAVLTLVKNDPSETVKCIILYVNG